MDRSFRVAKEVLLQFFQTKEKKIEKILEDIG